MFCDEDEEYNYRHFIGTIDYFVKKAMEERTSDTLSIRDEIEDEIGNLHDLVDSEGATLLHYCAKKGVISRVTQYLVDYGLDVDARTNDGDTALMLAAMYNREDVVRILLKANAKIDITDNFGETIFEKLSVRFAEDSSILGALLMKLVDRCETEEEAAGKLFNAECPLHMAVFMKSSEIIKFYLERRVKNSFTPDTSAILDRSSALHLAVYFQDLKSVELLLEYGADINFKNKRGRAPIAYVRDECRYCPSGEHLKILKCLLDGGAELTTLTYDGWMQIGSVLTKCSKETVQLVLQSNLDLHAKDSFGETILHYMAANKNPGVLTLLPLLTLDIDTSSDNGFKALDFAINSGHISNVQILIELGADVNSQSQSGTTPLYHAIVYNRSQNLECVELLLQYGAEVQIMFENNSTIFDLIDRLHESNDIIQLVLVHLALLEATGKLIKNELKMKINANPNLHKSFDMYKQQLEKLKEIKIYESVTLFQLLTMSEKQLLANLRNEQLVSELNQADCKNNTGVFYRKLRSRIACACKNQQLKNRVVVALCKIMQFSYNSYPTIIDMIYSYLSKRQLHILAQIENMPI